MSFLTAPRTFAPSTSTRMLSLAALAALIVALLAPLAPEAQAAASPKGVADQIMRMDYKTFLNHKRSRPRPFDWSDDGCSSPTPPHMRNLFNGPCQQHDFGYRNYGNIRGLKLDRNDGQRRFIDQRLLEESRRVCNQQFPRWWQQVNKDQCHREANAMWAAVRAGGSRAFYG